jgi:AcrR family transcriptional regulator
MTRQRLPAAERRQQIADAALRILAERGPHHLTALAVAREVGVADASLFKHFAGMEAIVEAAIERFGEALAADLQRPESDPVDKLAGFFAARLATLRARPELLQVAFNAWPTPRGFKGLCASRPSPPARASLPSSACRRASKPASSAPTCRPPCCSWRCPGSCAAPLWLGPTKPRCRWRPRQLGQPWSGCWAR